MDKFSCPFLYFSALMRQRAEENLITTGESPPRPCKVSEAGGENLYPIKLSYAIITSWRPKRNLQKAYRFL